MQIRFPFQFDKALAAMSMVLEHLGGRTDKAKLMKLLYIADREHFIREGYPITGDSQVAMKHGPLPSGCLDLLNGSFADSLETFEYLHTENHSVSLVKPYDRSVLADSEQRVLMDVLQSHGHKDTWALVSETHDFPEYRETYVEDTSTRIPYETMLKHFGGARGYRHGRAVISQATASHMLSPFRTSETDL